MFLTVAMLVISLFSLSGCFAFEPKAPYLEEYVFVIDGVVQTNTNGEYRIYSFSQKGIVFEKLACSICYKVPNGESSSKIDANISRSETTYTISWGILINKKEEIWVFDQTNNVFNGAEDKQLVTLSSLSL